MYTPVIKAIVRIGCNKYSGEIGMCTLVNRGAILNTGCFACTDAGLTRQISIAIASLCVTVAKMGFHKLSYYPNIYKSIS